MNKFCLSLSLNFKKIDFDNVNSKLEIHPQNETLMSPYKIVDCLKRLINRYSVMNI